MQGRKSPSDKLQYRLLRASRRGLIKRSVVSRSRSAAGLYRIKMPANSVIPYASAASWDRLLLRVPRVLDGTTTAFSWAGLRSYKNEMLTKGHSRNRRGLRTLAFACKAGSKRSWSLRLRRGTKHDLLPPRSAQPVKPGPLMQCVCTAESRPGISTVRY